MVAAAYAALTLALVAFSILLLRTGNTGPGLLVAGIALCYAYLTLEELGDDQ